MKIECQNFGPINKFSTDLNSDFLLIVGQNNIGKSYAISLIYIVLKTITSIDVSDRHFSFIIERLSGKLGDPMRKDFHDRYNNSKKDLDVTDVVREYLIEVFKILFVDRIEKSIAGTFGEISNLENRRQGGETLIYISTDDILIALSITDGHLGVKDFQINSKIVFRKSKQRRTPINEAGRIIWYGPYENAESALSDISFLAYRQFMEFIEDASSEVIDVHYLPASRSGLYQALSAFGQIIAELAKQRTFLSQRIELPAISEPLVDYFLKVTEIQPQRRPVDQRYQAIAELLESKILGGQIEFDRKSKRLFYKPYNIDLRLDLSSTSSMVSEVAPIVTYIKHVLPESSQRKARKSLRFRTPSKSRSQLIFIEEPEAHLHPNNQVLLMEAFANLVKDCNVKIIMTSHSNFVFNKVSNLVISGSLSREKCKAMLFVGSEFGTLSRDLDVDRYGITDENFVDTAETLYLEKVELLEGMETENAI